jgi:Nucleotide modification associated domain 3
LLMKVILSRKGFDSASGGMPSPILPDGTLISLPIPRDRPGSGTAYGSIRAVTGGSLAQIMNQLRVPVPPDGAHLDPDLVHAAVPRDGGWRPLFGQDSQAERHLENQHVAPGDLFLFFGLFRQTVLVDGQLRWASRAPRLHVLFGYLEIGEIRHIGSPADVTDLPWAAGHPHVKVWHRPGNTLYVAAARSALAPGWPGAGLFRFSATTQLTRPGAVTSIWQLPAAFASCAQHLSYHVDAKRWHIQSDGTVILHTVGRGQEFVTEADDGLNDWTRQLIEANAAEEPASQGEPLGPERVQ